MAKNFTSVPVAVNQHSEQNLSHPVHMTSDFGRLDVVYCNSDIIPGDTVNLKIDGFLRGAPMPAPTYGKVDVDIRVFFVPHRILCSRENEPVTPTTFSWDNYITGVSSASHPYIALTDVMNRLDRTNQLYVGTNYDRDLRRLYSELRLPSKVYNYSSPGTAEEIPLLGVNPWRFAAYQRVWWDWFRDSSLIDEGLIRNYVPLVTSGVQSSDIVKKFLQPQFACFKKDYFTTAKLNPQSGSSSVVARNVFVSGSSSPSNVISYDSNSFVPSNGDTGVTSGSVPIQWFRAANALQKYLERNNLAGSRLMERFLARFGNTPSAIALDMSEYLGGSSRSLNIGDITSNNEQDGLREDDFTNSFATPSSSRGTMQGQLGGKSASDASSGNITYHAKEFGTLIAIQVIRPNVMYTDGLPRELTRGAQEDRFSYFTPEMENLGYQPLYKRELAYTSLNSQEYEIFGFVPRYSDYKVAQGVVAGDFVLDGTKEGMNSWYFSRDIDPTDPVNSILSPAFTTISPFHRLQLDRVFSIPGTIGQYDHFNGFYHAEVHINRPMSADSLPALDEDITPKGSRVEIQNGGIRM